MDWSSDHRRGYRERMTRAVELADVRRILDDIGLRYKMRANGDLWFRCVKPDHPERDASAHINSSTSSSHHGVWHCFGCRASGNIVGLVQEMTGRAFGDALAFVEARLRVPSPEDYRARDEEKPVRQSIGLPRDYEFYVDQEKWNPPYVDYLTGRSIIWSQVVRHRIGYCDGGPYERRIIVPVYLGRELRTWIGRSIWDERQRVTSAPGGRPGLFGSELSSPERGPAILAEGWADALALERVGYANAMSLQTNALHQDQLDFLARFRRVILVPDGDQGGRNLINAAATLVAQCQVFLARLPNGMDPAQLSEAGRERELVTAIEQVTEWKPVVRDWLNLVKYI